MRVRVQEYFAEGKWRLSAEIGDGDATQYFHVENPDHDTAYSLLMAEVKSFKSYEVEL